MSSSGRPVGAMTRREFVDTAGRLMLAAGALGAGTSTWPRVAAAQVRTIQLEAREVTWELAGRAPSPADRSSPSVRCRARFDRFGGHGAGHDHYQQEPGLGGHLDGDLRGCR